MDEIPTCPLCRRVIPPHAKQSLHHLIPKLRGGKGGPTVLLHQICHNEIHATLSEAELARDFNTIETLRAHPDIARFGPVGREAPTGFSFEDVWRTQSVETPVEIQVSPACAAVRRGGCAPAV